MDRKAKNTIRRKKQLNMLRVLLVLVVAAMLAAKGHPYVAGSLVLVYYLVREAYLSDHIFYPVNADYCYNLATSWKSPLEIAQNISLQHVPDEIDTLLLALRIKSSISGHLLDPYVEIDDGTTKCRQYFERGASGLRYINLGKTSRALAFHHCSCAREGELLGFNNRIVKRGRAMVIAPHADDAELAAFGFYTQHDSIIVTLTAGEIEAEDFLKLEADPVEASRMKGLVRSHDSVAAARFGGIAAENIISLGYFCKQLSAMRVAPTENIMSRTAGLADTRFFRRFNKIRLASDAHGNSNWMSLVADIRELLERHRPTLVVTPHPLLDPHPDHVHATRALLEALAQGKHGSMTFLLYANHYHNNQMSPFGPAHAAASLPPEHEALSTRLGVYALPLDPATQLKKANALQMMHDLQKTGGINKRLRPLIQRLLAGRPENPYGQDDFFRRAVRAQEVFFVADGVALKSLLDKA